MSDIFPFSRPPVWQHTLGDAIACEGVGLHSGQSARLTLRPAAPGTGLVFRRTDLVGKAAIFTLSPKAVSETTRATSLGNAAGGGIATVEHVLAALSACGVDNAQIDVRGPEIPAMDGSALAFTQLISKAGLVQQSAPRRFIEILKPVSISTNGSRVLLQPSKTMQVDARINYPKTLIGEQSYHFEVTAAGFIRDIAPARTFTLQADVAALQNVGLALGGTLDNCLVVDGMGLQNKSRLRFADEFVRHKILDILGDIALAGAPLLGHFTSVCAGHSLNNALLRKLLAERSTWRWIELA